MKKELVVTVVFSSPTTLTDEETKSVSEYLKGLKDFYEIFTEGYTQLDFQDFENYFTIEVNSADYNKTLFLEKVYFSFSTDEFPQSLHESGHQSRGVSRGP